MVNLEGISISGTWHMAWPGGIPAAGLGHLGRVLGSRGVVPTGVVRYERSGIEAVDVI